MIPRALVWALLLAFSAAGAQAPGRGIAFNPGGSFKADALGFTLVPLARCVGDRERDLSEPLRRGVADVAAADPAMEHWRCLVLEVTELDARDQARIFDESLPEGLRLVSS